MEKRRSICAEVDWVPHSRSDQKIQSKMTRKMILHGRIKSGYVPFIKNTIENAIVGSIAECASVGKYLERIKSQFTGSSNICATQLLKQLVTEKYTWT